MEQQTSLQVLGKTGIGRKIGGCLCLLILSVIGTHLYALKIIGSDRYENSHASIINQQKWLTEKLLTEALASESRAEFSGSETLATLKSNWDAFIVKVNELQMDEDNRKEILGTVIENKRALDMVEKNAIDLISLNSTSQRTQAIARLLEARGELEKRIDATRKLIFAETASQRSATTRWIGLTSVPIVFLGLMLGWIISREVIKPLKQSIVDLERNAESTRASSRELSEASSAVSKSSTAQASAMQETVAAIAEMASMVALTAEQAQASDTIAKQVSQKTEDGTAVMLGLGSSMEEIRKSNGQLKEMSRIVSDIAERTNVINDIVFKTQLLSFNASIEAARAGQHGRGFAVVAEEVGKLALTSGQAAEDIQVLLEDSRRHVDNIVDETERRIEKGVAVGNQAQNIFNEIANEIVTISGQVQSVFEATKEQEQGINQVSEALRQMDDSTRANDKVAKRAEKLSDELHQKSENLNLIAASLRRLVMEPKRESGAASYTGSQKTVSVQDDASRELEVEPLSDDAIVKRLTDKGNKYLRKSPHSDSFTDQPPSPEDASFKEEAS